VAALPPVPNTLRVKFRWTYGLDTTIFNTLHFTYSGAAPTNAQLNTVASQVDAAVAAGLTLSQHPSVVLTHVEVVDLTSATSGIGEFVANRPGTAGGGQLPASVAVLVTFPIQRRYRGGKPRVYWPMGTDTDLANAQQWTATAQTNFLNRHQTTVGQIVALTWTGGGISKWVSVSYVLKHKWSQTNPPDGPWKSYPIYRDVGLIDENLGSVVSATVGSQRRRVRGKR